MFDGGLVPHSRRTRRPRQSRKVLPACGRLTSGAPELKSATARTFTNTPADSGAGRLRSPAGTFGQQELALPRNQHRGTVRVRSGLRAGRSAEPVRTTRPGLERARRGVAHRRRWEGWRVGVSGVVGGAGVHLRGGGTRRRFRRTDGTARRRPRARARGYPAPQQPIANERDSWRADLSVRGVRPGIRVTTRRGRSIVEFVRPVCEVVHTA